MIKIKRYQLLMIIIFTYFVTAISIYIDLPFFRQVLVLLSYFVIPAILILDILNIKQLNVYQFFSLIVGLGLAFLIFCGLIINMLFSTEKPFSLICILLNLNIICGTLAILSNRNFSQELDINIKPNMSIIKKDEYLYISIIPVLFPFFSILGTYLMNNHGNNILLLFLLFLIPFYALLLIILRKKIPTFIFPVSAWLIGLSLLLMHSLTCNYITGSDIHMEFYVFQLTKHNLFWDLANSFNITNTCLSVTILPTILEQLMNINDYYIYKLVFPVIFSFIIPVVYMIYNNYLDAKYSFLACFFFVSQSSFIFEFPEHARQEIALLFFSLSLMVYFGKFSSPFKRKILLFIFVSGMIVSHYTTAYVFFFILMITWLLITFYNTLSQNNESKRTNIRINFLIFCFAFIFLWYGCITSLTFNSSTYFLVDSLEKMADIFLLEAKDEAARVVIGIGIERGIPYLLQFITRTVTFFIIFCGVIHLFKNRNDKKYDFSYFSMSFACLILLLSMIILPHFSSGYGITRLYIQSLVILAPCLIFGAKSIWILISNQTFSKKCLGKNSTCICLYLIVILLIMQNICATTLIFNIFSVPLTEDLNLDGNNRQSLYIYESEIFAAKWLAENNDKDYPINSDMSGYQRVYLGYIYANNYKTTPPITNPKFFTDIQHRYSGYVFLRRTNVLDRIIHNVSIFPKSSQTCKLDECYYTYSNKYKIYSNKYSEIWL